MTLYRSRRGLTMERMSSSPRVEPRLVICLAAVYLIWSSTYLAIRYVLIDLPPMYSASMRVIAAGTVLMAVAFRRGAAWPSRPQWLAAVPVGGLLFVGGNGLVVLSEQSVSSGGAAVVCAMMPLWVGVLGAIGGERPSRREWAALVIGFLGVFVLMGGPTLSGEPQHIVYVLLSPMCWGLGSLLARKIPRASASDAFLHPGMQMLCGGALLAIVGTLRGEHIPLHASATSWLALGYLWLFGSLLGFTAYSWLLRNARPVVATSYAYVNPILAVLIGAALYGEPLGVTTLIANVLIVTAVWLALRRPRTR